jgi:hypothetical protein
MNPAAAAGLLPGPAGTREESPEAEPGTGADAPGAEHGKLRVRRETAQRAYASVIRSR